MGTCIKLVNNEVTAVWSDTHQSFAPDPSIWTDVSNRPDRRSIELGSTFDPNSDTFTAPSS